MHELIAPLFVNRLPDVDALLAYGFTQTETGFAYTAPLLPGFTLTVTVKADGTVATKVIDDTTGDRYTLHEHAENTGAFVAKIRAAVLAALTQISTTCFKAATPYHNAQTHALIAAVQAEFNDRPEFLWKRFPTNSVFRRQDTKKWYGAILTAKADKLGLPGDATLELLDLRMDPAAKPDLDGDRFLPGYHMNKQHWYSVVLDGRVTTAELIKRLHASFTLATK